MKIIYYVELETLAREEWDRLRTRLKASDDETGEPTSSLCRWHPHDSLRRHVGGPRSTVYKVCAGCDERPGDLTIPWIEGANDE